MSNPNFTFRDLGLGYLEATHGVQSAIAFEMAQKQMDANANPALNMLKHVRVGADMSKADMSGLVFLLVNKGVFTMAEYEEAMRIAANEELARYTDHVNSTYNVNVSFR